MDNQEVLSHIDAAGRAKMVDVGGKAITERVAIAKGAISMAPATLERIAQGQMAKGDVLAVAQVAAIMGAKQTAGLVPMCHPLNLSGVAMDFQLNQAKSRVEITAEVKVSGPTGVEMEALTAVSVAALTIYDMCKAVDKAMVIENIRLEFKSGGKSGTWQREANHG